MIRSKKTKGMKMKCPFLKETRVKFCQVSPIKKMIVSDQGDAEIEKCSTSSWTSCPVAQQRVKDQGQYKQCPFLQESHVQYCSLSSVTKFVPYNEAPFSRCTNTNHRYCEDYLSVENPDSMVNTKPSSATEDDKDTTKDYRVLGIRMPRKLQYSLNHMWMDEAEDGLCHIGVDAFFTKVLGPVQEVSFITTKGVRSPTVVLTVNGVELEVVFPQLLLISGMNTYLRSTPEKLSTDPYGAGWLFVGQKTKQITNGTSLLQGKEAIEWMRKETQRLNQFVHNEINHSELDGKALMADGGVSIDSLASNLQRDDIRKLFHNFFSPYVIWRNQR